MIPCSLVQYWALERRVAKLEAAAKERYDSDADTVKIDSECETKTDSEAAVPTEVESTGNESCGIWDSVFLLGSMFALPVLFHLLGVAPRLDTDEL